MALWARKIALGAIGNCLTINNNYEDHLSSLGGSYRLAPFFALSLAQRLGTKLNARLVKTGTHPST